MGREPGHPPVDRPADREEQDATKDRGDQSDDQLDELAVAATQNRDELDEQDGRDNQQSELLTDADRADERTCPSRRDQAPAAFQAGEIATAPSIAGI